MEKSLTCFIGSSLFSRWKTEAYDYTTSDGDKLFPNPQWREDASFWDLSDQLLDQQEITGNFRDMFFHFRGIFWRKVGGFTSAIYHHVSLLKVSSTAVCDHLASLIQHFFTRQHPSNSLITERLTLPSKILNHPY